LVSRVEAVPLVVDPGRSRIHRISIYSEYCPLASSPPDNTTTPALAMLLTLTEALRSVRQAEQAGALSQ
jgi:hypothetical protein